MLTSATGTSISRAPRSRGFTLLELLVVLFIIGLVTAVAMLSMSASGGNRDVTEERDRLVGLIDVLREKAELENREYGLRLFQGGYEFMIYDDRAARWVRLPEERILRGRKLPTSLEVTLYIEGRPVILPKADAKDATPQVMLFSSGDLNDFDMTVKRRGSALGFRLSPAQSSYDVEIENLPAAARS
jgi:general secretion pathway protein H